jgi:hypothetical protein
VHLSSRAREFWTASEFSECKNDTDEEESVKRNPKHGVKRNEIRDRAAMTSKRSGTMICSIRTRIGYVDAGDEERGILGTLALTVSFTSSLMESSGPLPST